LVWKINDFQKEQQQVCILDLTVINRLNFLKEANCVNVDIFHACWGLYIVGNIKELEKALATLKNHKQGMFMFNMISYCKKNGLVYQVTDTVTSEFIFSKCFITCCSEFLQESVYINNFSNNNSINNQNAVSADEDSVDNNKNEKMKNSNISHEMF